MCNINYCQEQCDPIISQLELYLIVVVTFICSKVYEFRLIYTHKHVFITQDLLNHGSDVS